MLLPVSGYQPFQACHREVRWVLFSEFHTYTSEIFDLVLNKVHGYADDSTLLAVVRKPADRLAVAASLNRDLARIQEWCNHWCLILTPYKTKVLLVSRSSTLKSPHGDLVMSGVFSFSLVPTSTSLASSFTASSSSKIMCVKLFLLSLREFVF